MGGIYKIIDVPEDRFRELIPHIVNIRLAALLRNVLEAHA